MPNADLLILHVASREPRRLDQLVLEALRERDPKAPLSRALLKKFFRASPPVLDGRAAEASTEIEGRHSITLTGWSEFAERASVLKPAEHCFLPILYEDEDLLVLNKASGVPSVALSGEETHTAVAAALARVPALASIPGAKPLEPGLLHRLDTGTSGVLAFAKTAEEFARLRALWKTPAVKKIYLAVVEPAPGTAPPSPCTIRDAIARSADAAARMVVLAPGQRVPAIRGKPLLATTHIRHVEPLPGGGFQVEVEIETGIMHQIRAHLASRGWPVLGDRIYNANAKRFSPPRLMLHAWKLELPLKNGTVFQITNRIEWLVISDSAEGPGG